MLKFILQPFCLLFIFAFVAYECIIYLIHNNAVIVYNKYMLFPKNKQTRIIFLYEPFYR